MAYVHHHVDISRYLKILTMANLRLLMTGLAAGSAVGLGAASVGRPRRGAVPVLVATVWAAGISWRWDRPTTWSATSAAGGLVYLLAGAGTA